MVLDSKGVAARRGVASYRLQQCVVALVAIHLVDYILKGVQPYCLTALLEGHLPFVHGHCLRTLLGIGCNVSFAEMVNFVC